MCSRKSTGSWQRKAVRSIPAASRAREGNITIRPGTWAKIDSPLWLCQMAPPVRYPPIGTRSTMGTQNSPPERHRMVAASVLICCMAVQM